jgi:hypothetical protein
MLILECLFKNQNHYLSLGTTFINGVGLVWVIFITFIFNYWMLIDNITFCIFRIQVTIISSFYFVNTPWGPTFLHLVIPFKWFESEVVNKFQYFAAFLRDVFPSPQHPWHLLVVGMSILPTLRYQLVYIYLCLNLQVIQIYVSYMKIKIPKNMLDLDSVQWHNFPPPHKK